MIGFKLKLVKWGRNYGLLRDFINFYSLSENNHENTNWFTKKKDGKVSFYLKNTNSRIEETLDQSDGIIEEIETF